MEIVMSKDFVINDFGNVKWLCAYRGNAEHVTVPDGVTEISRRAFMNCTSVKTVTLPASCEKIMEEAFSGCTSLEKLIIRAENLYFLGQRLFSGVGRDFEIVFEGSSDYFNDQVNVDRVIDVEASGDYQHPSSSHFCLYDVVGVWNIFGDEMKDEKPFKCTVQCLGDGKTLEYTSADPADNTYRRLQEQYRNK